MFNLLVQLLVGLPLEMVHGSFRIGCIYMAGVLAGSLGTSVFDPDVYLVGASGGVYALLAAHLANVLLNYNNMEFGILRLLGVFLIGMKKKFLSLKGTSYLKRCFFLKCSFRRRGFRHLRQIRRSPTLATPGGRPSSSLLRCALDRGPGRFNDWLSRPQEL
jgi:hypothetical protein